MAVRVSAINRAYHPEHFVCGQCSSQLSTECFYILDGVLYCKSCEENHSSKKHPLNRTTAASSFSSHSLSDAIPGRTYRCTRCSRELSSDRLLSFEGHPMCSDCYSGRTPPIMHQNQPNRRLPAPLAQYAISAGGEVWHCSRCRQVINDSSCMMALDRYWHKHCFVCSDCHMPVPSNCFFVKNGMPYCALHK